LTDKRPPELYHALRHMLAAVDAWERGQACEARAHLREVGPDLIYAHIVIRRACEAEAASD
jgi:hypothetical protein